MLQTGLEHGLLAPHVLVAHLLELRGLVHDDVDHAQSLGVLVQRQF